MKGQLIGAFTNKWRGRRVEIFEDLADPSMVYTTGTPLGTPPLDPAAVVESHEPRAHFTNYIGSFDKVYL